MAKRPDSNKAADSHLVIDAYPTKQLFIAMLTRDVALIPAIIDLADNCTDGARRLRNGSSWAGLEVRINGDASGFSISDNCGGMDVETARKNAFRFGRPAEVAATKGEVGRFGVGMKRGLFKIGKHFFIKSTTAQTQFEVTIDVPKWEKELDWQFHFDNDPIESGSFSETEVGTTIVVKALHKQVSEHFVDTVFIEELRKQLTSKLEQSILQGLAVLVNGTSLRAHSRELVTSDILAPARKRFDIKGPSGRTVNVELYCGLGKPSTRQTARSEAGWYVFCNGRMLLEADKSTATGWGVEDEETIPAYHPQFNDFRGYAHIDASDGEDLPWNTMKTALDTDHPVYRRVKQEMIAITRPVIDYFNKRKEENDSYREAGETARGPLQVAFDTAKTAPLSEVSARPVFEVPRSKPKKKANSDQHICFDRPQYIAEQVRDAIQATSWREVGEFVFDYYFNSELSDG